MEVMEDGNLMDKVIILIQRDMDYYKVSLCIHNINCQWRNVSCTKESLKFSIRPQKIDKIY